MGAIGAGVSGEGVKVAAMPERVAATANRVVNPPLCPLWAASRVTLD